MKLLVTGGAGFIGSAFVRLVLKEHPRFAVVNLDKLTYAGNLENLSAVAESPNYRFVKGDIADGEAMRELFAHEKPDAVVHFAAESHVDRSILSPEPVVRTNFHGTFCLLEAARRNGAGRFLHVSTDEVYGSLEEPREADENYPL
ncbi:MAG: GDP-mannose 4,6-dehydratase, partial [Bryobacterales bacterium]|nr:GDP-mannose 4,6-dehydratase [Bryobacterales bacterium]